jgi:cullin 2
MSLKPRRVDFNVTWGAIRDTITGVITLDHVPRPVWNDRFSDVYSLCVAHPEPMADRLYAETKQYLIDHVSKLLVQVQEDGEMNLVKSYYHYWSQYSVGSQYLHSLYLYLNQQHIRTQKMSDAEIIYGSSDSSAGEQMEIGELALEVWQSGMIAPLGPRLVKLLLEALSEDRAQRTCSIPIEAVRGTILSFVEVKTHITSKCKLANHAPSGSRLQEEGSTAAVPGDFRGAVLERKRRTLQKERRQAARRKKCQPVYGEGQSEN